MGLMTALKAQLSPSGAGDTPTPASPSATADEKQPEMMKSIEGTLQQQNIYTDPEIAGAAKIEAIESVWGKRGRYMLYLGLAMMMIIFELDNSTVGTYLTYATSSFDELSMLSTLTTAASIILAVFKPPIAKMSDVIGRGETYIFTVSCFILSYILCASSATINVYAGGYVLYAIGQSGTAMLDAILICDLTSMRWRGFSYNIIYLPFLITPWISGVIVDSVVDGIGWRWGIGMFAILMPVCAATIITTLLVFQRRAKRAGLVLVERITIYEFCSRIDLGGTILLSGGFAMILLPITLAATTTSKWQTPWVDVLVALGVVALICLYPYEKWVAKHPVVPVRYFSNLAVVIPVLIACLDNMGFGSTHTYLYAWSIVSHNMSARNALYLAYVNGVVQCLTGMLVGTLMYRTRSFKWIGVAGAIIRLIGYGVMIRLRTNHSSVAELFVVQFIQGIGSGIIETVNIVCSQIVVPHAELAQVTALIFLGAFLGDGIGAAIAGGIYTDTLRGRLAHHLGSSANATEINELYDSITGVLPTWGTPERLAVDEAYSDVITIAALALSVPVVVLAFFMPNNRLGDGRNLMEGVEPTETKQPEAAVTDAPIELAEK
ncbi:hypothetical protein ASPZODRAFT_1158477 [Penicilliopsis zonata CBS 506.65]|uniref:Major facilitator superfamily (MFS) profile domain-containing protein n=1 Tax=Penicilliopsis zonata CBS 506.65 TaxID=1073090 RepID=A0A1L9ST46_9EURO|nr:hypothetical protein ASPZODRAFT_1158477 [Penicilliopsis zonata CBS 506.65]OJJ50379.1 hypothetical protein ASPZODRAFT_1158477 [Penicilliopsis zonata CBS 506.65]